jgi:plastocyanin
VVHRRLTPALWLLASLGAALLAWPASSLATNTRVAISNYEWSIKEIHIDLDEKVSWEWIGPDLMHSVTGVSPNAVQWDSDPGTDVPRHEPGDEFTIQFTEPGEYLFQCKMHPFVRGKVIVSDVPGDPNSSFGPRFPLRISLKPPTLGEVKLKKTEFAGSAGVPTKASISEGGTLDAEYYRLDSKGRRVYNGYHEWSTFLGINYFRLAARWKHFKARPGRYVAVLRATDKSNNTSKPVTKSFTIEGTPPPDTRKPGSKL